MSAAPAEHGSGYAGVLLKGATRASCLSDGKRSRSALLITEAELRLMASAAIIGDSSQPVNG